MMDDGQGALFLAAGFIGGHVTSRCGKEGKQESTMAGASYTRPSFSI
jgi:hypothetical protein